MKINKEPNQEYLNALFNYEDGKLYWKVKKATWMKIGDRAGTISFQGYRKIIVDGIQYMEHRLIWSMINGRIPENLLVDHRDQNPLNNNLENLRLATHGQNTRNSKFENKTGFRGVYKDEQSGKFRAIINLGLFKTAEEAFLEYEKYSKIIHKEFAQ